MNLIAAIQNFLEHANQSFLVLLIMAAVLNGTPLLFGTVGEVLSEKAGNLNLGVEGMMFMGGALGLGGAFYYEKIAGASANGRKAWLPLSDGISPTQGADFKGPTAIIKSVSKMANDNMNIGMVHNFKLMSGLLDTPEGENGIVTLIRTASILGNGEMQFNYLDNNTLLDAQRHPENYRDLVVRVAGYSAFFVELCKDVQDEIISRTVLRSI